MSAKVTVGCGAFASDSAGGIELVSAKSGGGIGERDSLGSDKLASFNGPSIGSRGCGRDGGGSTFSRPKLIAF